MATSSDSAQSRVPSIIRDFEDPQSIVFTGDESLGSVHLSDGLELQVIHV